ncbi:FEKKY domain-containing protein [Flavobacterium tibetense]|uniref:Uncharacterized protein n=1 Tax=Flavobacterium tibetense TaxID=2233533 RepID=A0A365P2R1_9FLAO|nr:hypothetical protein [Flavobacterium tibetense]RBA28788.1 hypothetical protein DPN68_05205 [Flavobacterium tibetense]
MKKFIVIFTLFTFSFGISQNKKTSKEKPLIVLNQKIISYSQFEQINPNLVDSISVLKDKKAIDKYGEKGENGVIEVYTKKPIFQPIMKTKTIYLLGGIAASITKEDMEFAKKYGFIFHNFGCIAPVDFEKYETKNAQVFDWLNETYGTDWQKEMKSSAFGFEKWKMKE